MQIRTGPKGLAALRRSRGMTQEDLAAAAQVRATSISRYERAKATPSVAIALRMADALGVEIGDLFEEAS